MGAWVHPRDLALRAAHLIGATELPNTAGRHWEDMDPTDRLVAEGHVATALTLARFLHQLTGQPRFLAAPDAVQTALARSPAPWMCSGSRPGAPAGSANPRRHPRC
jgi:hypothetical protein